MLKEYSCTCVILIVTLPYCNDCKHVQLLLVVLKKSMKQGSSLCQKNEMTNYMLVASDMALIVTKCWLL